MGEGYKATLEWGFWKFIKYLIVVFAIAWTVSWATTRYLDFDILFWNWMYTLHTTNLWLLIPEVTLIIGAVGIWKWDRYSQKKARYKRWKQTQDKILQDGGD